MDDTHTPARRIPKPTESRNLNVWPRNSVCQPQLQDDATSLQLAVRNDGGNKKTRTNEKTAYILAKINGKCSFNRCATRTFFSAFWDFFFFSFFFWLSHRIGGAKMRAGFVQCRTMRTLKPINNCANVQFWPPKFLVWRRHNGCTLFARDVHILGTI